MSKSPRRRSRHTDAEIREALARYHQSGLSQRGFARSEGISITTLGNWLRRHRERSGGRPERPAERTQLLPVSMPMVAFGPADFELVLDDGRRLCIPPDFDVAALGRLLKVLAAC